MHHCNLNEGQTGRCRARKNVGGINESISYGKITSIALDPIEKKPLNCFESGKKILSVGSFGCNLDCPFCQNDSISMAGVSEADFFYLSPKELVLKAEEFRKNGNIGIAYTYNEPLIGYEFVLDTAKLIREAGMKNVVVTNGSVTIEILNKVLPYIDAFNIDLKAITESFYKKIGGDLEIVKDFIKIAAAHSHIEITTLIVPGENDSAEEIEELSRWIAKIDKNIPLHISRFFPRRKMIDEMPTSVALIHALAEIAKKNLNRVFIGNC